MTPPCQASSPTVIRRACRRYYLHADVNDDDQMDSQCCDHRLLTEDWLLKHAMMLGAIISSMLECAGLSHAVDLFVAVLAKHPGAAMRACAAALLPDANHSIDARVVLLEGDGPLRNTCKATASDAHCSTAG